MFCGEQTVAWFISSDSVCSHDSYISKLLIVQINAVFMCTIFYYIWVQLCKYSPTQIKNAALSPYWANSKTATGALILSARVYVQTDP